MKYNKDWLIKVMAILNLTVQELSDLSGLSYQTIKNLRSGRSKGTAMTWKKISTIIKIVKKTRISVLEDL